MTAAPTRTAALVTSNLHRFPTVRLLVNERNMGFGWSYRRGVDAAASSHIVMVHGDNAWGYETLRELFSHVGEADVIIGYTRDMWRSRTRTRTLISKGYTFVVNRITGRRLQYYNGLQIHPAPVLKSLRIQSSGYGFQSEVLVKALRRTRTLRGSADGSDRARQGREQGVSRQERRRRPAHHPGAVRGAVGRAMLDPSRPGDPAAEPTALKRERSGSRKIVTLAELTGAPRTAARQDASSSVTAPSTSFTWATCSTSRKPPRSATSSS